MTTTQRIQVFDSSSQAYHKAFQTFLDHTDQKTRARETLGRKVAGLTHKRIFIDAGAGNGKVTAWFTDSFQQTLAMEPNPSLRQELATVCPRAKILPDIILEAKVSDKADFILASHVFYYIPGPEWMANLDRMVSWLAPQGTLIVILQNSQSDCMQMLRHFLKRAFDLKQLAGAFEEKAADDLEVSVETVPSRISTPDLDKAYSVAEFMLNLLPLPEPPASAEVCGYVQKHFKAKDGSFRFSCTQDFLQIRRRPA